MSHFLELSYFTEILYFKIYQQVKWFINSIFLPETGDKFNNFATDVSVQSKGKMWEMSPLWKYYPYKD